VAWAELGAEAGGGFWDWALAILEPKARTRASARNFNESMRMTTPDCLFI
jgi:hypothetical protein